MFFLHVLISGDYVSIGVFSSHVDSWNRGNTIFSILQTQDVLCTSGNNFWSLCFMKLYMNTYKWIIGCDEATHRCLFRSQFLPLQPQALNQSIILSSYSLRHLKYKDSSLFSSFDSLNISFHANWKVHVSLGHHRLFCKKLCPFLYYLSITPHFCHLRRRWFAHTL